MLTPASTNAICITGTDTGIGKTVFTGLLAKALSATHSVVTQKWVQCGDVDQPDIAKHHHDAPAEHQAWRQVYTFEQPVSPHLASSLSNCPIHSDALIAATHALSARYQYVLLETSGGIMVPLNQHQTVGDVVASMGMPTVVVVANRLGCINHALLTLDYLAQRNIPILGFVMNHIDDADSPMHRDNPRIIQALSKARQLGSMHRKNGVDTLTSFDITHITS